VEVTDVAGIREYFHAAVPRSPGVGLLAAAHQLVVLAVEDERRAGVRREFARKSSPRDVRPRVAELLRIEAGADDLSLDIRRQLPIPYPARREFLDGTLSDIGFRQKPRQSPVSRVPSSIEFTGFTLLPDNTSALTSSGWRYAYSVAA